MTQPLTPPITLPYLADQFMLRPGVTFLNNGSFGACPRPVFAVYQEWQRELEAQPVEFLGRRVRPLLAEARQALAPFIGAGPEEIVFIPNATMGVNIVARSLALGPGDEVLTTNHEYGAAFRAWKFICQQRGARLVEQPLPVPAQEPGEFADAIWAGVTERTRVIFLSHITSPTALTLPVAEICRRAREAGILTVVDGAHVPGQLDLDLTGLGADFYFGNLHKWLLAPKGCAFLYARPAVQGLLHPLVVSWGWEALEPGPSTFLDYFEWTGTVDPAAFLTAPAAIRFWQEHDWPRVREACHALVCDFHRRMGELTGLTPLTPARREWFTQLAALPLPPGTNVAQLKDQLWDEWQIEIPILDWQGRPLIRISVQAFNGPGDVERLMAALGEIMGRG